MKYVTIHSYLYPQILLLLKSSPKFFWYFGDSRILNSKNKIIYLKYNYKLLLLDKLFIKLSKKYLSFTNKVITLIWKYKFHRRMFYYLKKRYSLIIMIDNLSVPLFKESFLYSVYKKNKNISIIIFEQDHELNKLFFIGCLISNKTLFFSNFRTKELFTFIYELDCLSKNIYFLNLSIFQNYCKYFLKNGGKKLNIFKI